MSVGVDMGLDTASGKESEFVIKDTYMKPTSEYPKRSWLHEVNGEVKIATGYYTTLYTDKPSPYFHGDAPFFILENFDVPWDKK